MMPKVSPRMRAQPCAASRICSGPVNCFPSATDFANQYVRRYKFKIRHKVLSATSSTAKAGTLHTDIPKNNKIMINKK